MPTLSRTSLWLGALAAAAGLGAATWLAHRRQIGWPCLYLLAGGKKRGGQGGQGNAADAPLAEVATVDLHTYLNGTPEERAEECRKAAQSLHRTGCLYIRDPRVQEEDNDRFLDMLEKYFAVSDGKRDARPEVHYQVGVTPAFTEKPRDHCARVAGLQPTDRPSTICPPEADPKWRFFWRIGPRPASSRFADLNPDPVVPPEFPEWTQTMDHWGGLMLGAVTAVARMSAEGFGLHPDTFANMMQNGPHLLAPTGSDFAKYGEAGTVLAGYHYDLNLLTIHGRSRFPGLYIWLRDGRKVAVRVPPGCLLVQAGKQMEYLTGGHVLAGFHEVVVSPDTISAIKRRQEEGQSLWRVSSTLFSHIASDHLLQPLAHFSTPESRKAFPPTYTGDQVMEELRAIKLGSGFTLNNKTPPPAN